MLQIFLNQKFLLSECHGWFGIPFVRRLIFGIDECFVENKATIKIFKRTFAIFQVTLEGLFACLILFMRLYHV